MVKEVAEQLGEPEYPAWQSNVSPRANEAGLDLVFFRSFADGRSGYPVYLVQCASGSDWETKLHTPVLAVWQKLVDFAAPPQKAFAVPLSLEEEHMRRITVRVAGIVYDRYRLHDGSRLPAGWCSKKLVTDLGSFLRPIVRKLPGYG